MGSGWSETMKQVFEYCKDNPKEALEYAGLVLTYGKNFWNFVEEKFSKAAPNPAPMPAEMTPDQITKERNEAREILKIDTVNDFNIAFCGQVKAGKSRMINAIRGVQSHPNSETVEIGEAKVGNMRCTNDIQPFRFMDGSNQHLVLWDCPGAGQLEDHSRASVKSYFKDKKLYAFDYLLLFLGETVRTEDLEFAKEAFRYNVPFAFVRSRSDMSIDERINAEVPAEKAKREFLEINRKAFSAALSQGGGAIAQAPLFFVSAIIIEKQKRQQPVQFELEEGQLTLQVLNQTLTRRGCLS